MKQNINITSFWVSGYDNDICAHIGDNNDKITFKGSDDLLNQIRKMILSEVENAINKYSTNINSE